MPLLAVRAPVTRFAAALTMTVTPLVAALAACQSSGPGAGDAAPVADGGARDAGSPDADPDLLPDLTVDVDRARVDLAIRENTFAADSCELDVDEACIGGPGLRRLLHFSVETPNVGEADLVLGAPSLDNDEFSYSTCHQHFHFLGYAEYRLLDADGGELAAGRKQAFCLLDSGPFVDSPDVATQARYGCDFQGIQRGWADVYYSSLPCQFIDVTDVPDGSYTLQISINNGGTIDEMSFDNNVVTVPVELGGADLATPTEACPDDLAPHASEGENRECGWTLAETTACTPGQQVHIACSQGCGLGSCTGDPQLRVCDAARADGNCSFPAAIAADDDSCNSQCPTAAFVRCPASGQLAIYTAPFTVGDPYTCDVAVEVANP